jgi:hypothetical protein
MQKWKGNTMVRSMDLSLGKEGVDVSVSGFCRPVKLSYFIVGEMGGDMVTVLL